MTFTNTNLEKKLRQLERVSGEWKSKYDGVKMNLEELREHEKTLSLDLLRVKSNLETLQEKIEFLKKDNRGLLAKNKVQSKESLYICLHKKCTVVTKQNIES